PFKYNQNILKIPLKYHSCLGYYQNINSCHPNNLLQSNDNYYASKTVGELKNESYDWIIFEIDDNNQCQSYFLKYFKIRNRGNEFDIKSMGIEIGNIEKNEWLQYEPFPLNDIKMIKNFETYQ